VNTVEPTGTRTVVPGPTPEGAETFLPCDVAAYLAATARLLDIFTMTDIPITDKETPIQAILYGFHGGLSSAYSPAMMCTTQVLDAAVQTMNALHLLKPLDFGISLEDAANTTQNNELRWYIDVLDGKTPLGAGITRR
jgi:hypothetical protein